MKMPLFDAYIMVDWSGGDRRRRAKKPDCIWIAHAPAAADAPMTVSPPSRTEAAQIICAQLQSIVAAKHGRVLLCADFGYGYPGGFASLLANSVAGELPPWRIVWQYLGKHVRDDLGTEPGGRPTATIALRWRAPSTPPCPIQNARVHSGVSSKRVFTLAFHRNGRSSRSSARAAVWVRFVSQTGERRAILRFASSARAASAAKCLPGFRASSVCDSIPILRAAPPCGRSRPGGRPRADHGLIRRLRVLHAEIYPSVRERLPDTIKDRGQVRAMWHWARDLDARS